MNAKTPKIITKAESNNYTPALQKLDGYNQLPRPLVKPFQNKIDFTSELKCKEFIPKQKDSVRMVKKHHLDNERTGTSGS